MSHLSPDELLDLAEGAEGAEGASSDAAHLVSCEKCRQELAALRGIITAVGDIEIPEPSPLFWDYFSARVRVAVAQEEPRRQPFLSVWSWRFVGPLVLVAVVAALVVAVAFSRGAIGRSPSGSIAALPSPPGGAPGAPGGSGGPVDAVQPVSNAPAEGLAETAVDPSFAFVADLTADMDMDTALAAGLVSDSAAEHAVAHLSDGELRELAKLLTEEIARAQVS